MSKEEQSLGSRFPYLACWKANSDKFPEAPIIEVLAAWADIYKPTGKEARELLSHLLFEKRFPENNKSVVDEVLDEYYLNGIKEAELRIYGGEDKKTVVKEFGEKYLPSRKGGKTFYNDNQLSILKRIHIELQNAIKII
ncbi:MAG: hypothetical protein ACOWWM_16725 [Desulfobacterales bacterium]